MPELLFSNAALLAGLGALAIPVLIHLLLRRKPRRLVFSAIEFFMQQDEKTAQRRRLRHLLLLGGRLALLALIVLAFSRPYRVETGFEESSTPPRRVVFVLDRSASMQVGERWSRALAHVRQHLDQLDPRDRVALVESAGSSSLASAWTPPARLKGDLDGITPGFGASDLADGLAEAVRLLRGSLGAGASIHLVSDLQRSAIANLDRVSIPRNLELKVSSVSDAVSFNLAVLDLQIDLDGQRAARVTLSNLGNEDAKPVRLGLYLNGQLHGSAEPALPAGGKTNLVLPLPALSSGWHRVEARLESNDLFPADDRRYAAVRVAPPIRVVCVDDLAGGRSFEMKSFFVQSALNPLPDSAGLSPFRVDILSAEALEKRLPLVNGDLDLVVLPGLNRLPVQLGTRLTEFVRAGGGLLLFLGDEVRASDYNREFGQLLPAQLGRVQGHADFPEEQTRVGEYDLTSAHFAAFREAGQGDLQLPVFRRRFTLIPGEGSTVPARLQDGIPFIVESRLGRGKVVLVNTSAETSWSDWPRRKTFLPWLHEAARDLAGRSDLTEVALDHPAATTVSLDFAAAGGPGSFQIRTPENQLTALHPDSQGVFHYQAETPGIYSVRDGDGAEVGLAAVNVPRAESDLSAAAPHEIQHRIVRTQPERGGQVGPVFLQPGRDEFWRILLMAAAMLLVLEVVWANRTHV